MSNTRILAELIFKQVSQQFYLPPPNEIVVPDHVKKIYQFYRDLVEEFVTFEIFQTLSLNDLSCSRIDSLLLLHFKAMVAEIFHTGDCIYQFAACYRIIIDYDLMDKAFRVDMKNPGKKNYIHVFLKLNLSENEAWLQIDPWMHKEVKEHKNEAPLKDPQALYPSISKEDTKCLVTINQPLYPANAREWKQAGEILLRFQKQLTKEKIQELLKKNNCTQWRPQKNFVRIQRALTAGINWCNMHALRRPDLPATLALAARKPTHSNKHPSSVKTSSSSASVKDKSTDAAPILVHSPNSAFSMKVPYHHPRGLNTTVATCTAMYSSLLAPSHN